jgi:hypothetical protein
MNQFSRWCEQSKHGFFRHARLGWRYEGMISMESLHQAHILNSYEI